MADKIVVLRAGRVEQVGAPLELYNRPQNRFVAGFIGSPQMNFLSGRVVGGDGASARVALDAADPGAAPAVCAMAPAGATAGATREGRVLVGIRPEHVEVVPGPGAAIEVPATIERMEQLGAASFLYCKLRTGEAMTVHAPGQLAHRNGDPLVLRIPVAAAHLFDMDEPGAAWGRTPLQH